jgi:hypothetical protein
MSMLLNFKPRARVFGAYITKEMKKLRKITRQKKAQRTLVKESGFLNKQINLVAPQADFVSINET